MNPTPRILFWLILALALGLLGLLVVAPLVGDASRPVLELFARDAMLRRTALASSLALLVTAWVFFRPANATPRVKKAERPVPPPVIGA